MEPEIVKVLKAWTMEGEVNTFIKVWITAFAALCYCYYFAGKFPRGPSRLLAVIPVVFLNLYLPLNLHTMHLGGSTTFFLVWLANFKLLMFSCGNGPLAAELSLPRFIAIACLPIKFQDQPKGKITTTSSPPPKGLKPVWNYAIKGLLISLFLKVYDYSEHLHPKLILVVYSFHILFGLEIILAIAGGVAKALLGVGLQPQFDEPYLSSSLQDFWGRRWNVMVSRILRPSVYEPVINVSKRVVGRKWAPLPAIFSTFLVSAVMHELIFFYLGRNRPTGEITFFFLLHGFCLLLEIAVKKALSGYPPLPRIVTGPLTLGFVMMTAFWLFFPEFLRTDAVNRALQEYAALGAFLKDVVEALRFW